MKFFIGLVPPPPLYNSITEIQNQFGDNRLEPHITLRPPVIPADEENWLNSIKAVCSGFGSFAIKLPSTGCFGKSVLFINVQSDELSILFKAVKKALKPFEPKELQDNRPFHPHLTLGRSWCGFTKDDFDKMKVLADQLLVNPPVSFSVDSVRVYHKPGGNKKYEKLEDFPLIV